MSNSRPYLNTALNAASSNDQAPGPRQLQEEAERGRRRKRRCSMDERTEAFEKRLKTDTHFTMSNPAATPRRDSSSSSARQIRPWSSSSSSPFLTRPILQPTPSTSRSRSRSPIRKMMALLALASPPVRFAEADDNTVEVPAAVAEATRRLTVQASSRVIPGDLRHDVLQATPAAQASLMPPDAFSSANLYRAELLPRLWWKVKLIY